LFEHVMDILVVLLAIYQPKILMNEESWKEQKTFDC